jgi:hypothetical protein
MPLSDDLRGPHGAPVSAENYGLRRFNLGDLMILTVALAFGLATAVNVVAYIGDSYSAVAPVLRDDWQGWWKDFTRKVGPRSWVVQGCFQLLLCMAGPLAPALVVAGLRRPRPTIGRLVCQPGFLACAAVCLCGLIIVDVNFLRIDIATPPVLASLPGATVLASWVALGVAGRWRPEASWVDRAGRFVGSVWIAALPWFIWSAT